jgi:hypothetical protein
LDRCHADFVYRCCSCDKQLYSYSDYRDHYLADHESLCYLCRWCDLGFGSQLLLRRHELMLHRPVSFECKFCSCVFTTERFLANHVNSDHVVGGPRVTTPEAVALNENAVPDEVFRGRKMVVANTYCTICKTDFVTSSRLGQHNRDRHLEKKHMCALCLRRYSRPSALKNHILTIHCRVGDFTCFNCFTTVKTARALLEHVQIRCPRRANK